MEIYEIINAEYEKIRKQNEDNYKKFVNTVYAASPRIKEIDGQCSQLCIDYCRKVVSGEMSDDVASKKMQAEIDKLTAEKEQLLKTMGLTLKSMERSYTCEKCKDMGYADGKRCSCYYQKQSAALLKASNLNVDKSHTFSKYDLDLYSDKVDERYGFSPRENAQSIKEVAIDFAKGKKDAPKNLYFYGATGLGKTFTSDCIAHKFIEKRQSVFYISAPKLFSVYEDYKFGRDFNQNKADIISSVENSELLIIDDLGAEFHSSFVDSCLFEIINNRLSADKRTIISSNLSPKELSQNYSDRIASRILGGFSQLLFIGDDIRVKRIFG